MSQQFASRFSCIEVFRGILRFAQNDNLRQCVILRGGLCPEESLRSPEEGEFFPTNFMQLMMTLGLDGIKLDGTKMDFRKTMADTTVDALIVDLLHWLAARDRTYPEVIDVAYVMPQASRLGGCQGSRFRQAGKF